MNLGQWIGLLALGIFVYVLWQVRQLVLLLVVAVILATALNILARRLQRSGTQRVWAIAVSLIVLLALFAIILLLLIPPLVLQFQQLMELFPLGLERLDQWLNYFRAVIPLQVMQEVPDISGLMQQLQPTLNRLLGSPLAFISIPVTFAINLLLILVLTIMLLVSPHDYRDVFITLFPAFYRERVDVILTQCERALGNWFVKTLLTMACIAVLFGFGLGLLQVRLALVSGVLAGALAFIPYIGSVLGVVPPMLIALLDTPWKAIAVLTIYIVLYQITIHVIVPRLVRQPVSVLPAVALLAQVILTVFFGFLGLILAVPLVVVGQIWFYEVVIQDVLDHPSQST